MPFIIFHGCPEGIQGKARKIIHQRFLQRVPTGSTSATMACKEVDVLSVANVLVLTAGTAALGISQAIFSDDHLRDIFPELPVRVDHSHIRSTIFPREKYLRQTLHSSTQEDRQLLDRCSYIAEVAILRGLCSKKNGRRSFPSLSTNMRFLTLSLVNSKFFQNS